MKNNNNFFLFISIFLIIITLLIAYIRPITYFTKKTLSEDGTYILQIMEINKRILSYYNKEQFYPKSLHELNLLSDDSLNKIVEYKNLLDDYNLITKIAINDTILIISKDKIRKIPYEE